LPVLIEKSAPEGAYGLGYRENHPFLLGGFQGGDKGYLLAGKGNAGRGLGIFGELIGNLYRPTIALLVGEELPSSLNYECNDIAVIFPLFSRDSPKQGRNGSSRGGPSLLGNQLMFSAPISAFTLREEARKHLL
jgi:hypothetical protein